MNGTVSTPLSRCWGDAGRFGALMLQPRTTPQLLASFNPLLAAGGTIYCLDAANRFDPRPLALALRESGENPARCMERFFVSRAFTCHQFTAALGALPIPSVSEGRGPDEAGPPVVFLALGFDALFQGDDLPCWERSHLYGEALRAIRARAEAGLLCLATFARTIYGAPHGRHSGGSGRAEVGRFQRAQVEWERRLLDAADFTLQAVEAEGEGLSFRRRGAALAASSSVAAARRLSA